MEKSLNQAADISRFLFKKTILNFLLLQTIFRFLYDDEENMSLMIKNANPQDAGTYVINAKNELGADSAHLQLTVKGKIVHAN